MPIKKTVRKTSSASRQVGAPPPPPPPSSSPSSRVSFSNKDYVKEYEIEEEFVDEGSTNEEQGTTAELFSAAKAGDVFTLQRVLAKLTVPVDSRDHACRGRTALSYVAEKDKVECIKLLLSYGASAYVLDDDGLTPLKYYASVREPEVLFLQAMILGRPVVEEVVEVLYHKDTPMGQAYHGEAPLPPALPTMTAASRPPVPSLPNQVLPQQQQYGDYGFIPAPPLPELLPPSIRTSFIVSRTSSHLGDPAAQHHVFQERSQPQHTSSSSSLSSFFPSY